MKQLLVSLLLIVPGAVVAQAPQVVPVVNLGTAPEIDGDLAEWGATAG